MLLEMFVMTKRGSLTFPLGNHSLRKLLAMRINKPGPSELLPPSLCIALGRRICDFNACPFSPSFSQYCDNTVTILRV